MKAPSLCPYEKQANDQGDRGNPKPKSTISRVRINEFGNSQHKIQGMRPYQHALLGNGPPRGGQGSPSPVMRLGTSSRATMLCRDLDRIGAAHGK